MTDARLTRRAVAAGLLSAPAGAAWARERFTPGLNIIQTDRAPFGSPAAARSLKAARTLGAKSCAIVPFLWQSGPHAPGIVAGSDMTPVQLAAGVRQARAAGLAVTVKPHVWVPGGWAGVVGMTSDADWRIWFGAYQAAILAYAGIAAAAGAGQFCIGAELRQTATRPEWATLIAAVRSVFPGRLTYAAHGADDAEAVPFWPLLDAVGATLYPTLGATTPAWRTAMDAEVGRVSKVAAKAGKPTRVLEVGLRSAQGAAAKPWESAEERTAPVDETLQAQVLETWMQALSRPGIAEVLVWRWFSDPDAGGSLDTDFTIQGKAAAATLAARWR